MKNPTLKKLSILSAAAMALVAVPFTAAETQTSAATLLAAEFETTNDSFTGRGGASVAWTSDCSYSENCSLFVSGRTNTWQGASRDASSIMKGGQTYAVSAAVYQESGEPVEMKFSLQYTDSTGTTSYDKIALDTAESGEWTVLSNETYTVPDGASDLQIYVETTESLTDFYVDLVTVKGAPASIKAGDANGDLTVNDEDTALLAKYIVNDESAEVEMGADFDNDKNIDVFDLVMLQDKLANPKTASVEGDWDNYQETATPQMLKVYQNSLLNMGNTKRIREKIAKAQSGEDVNIAYLGGSITAGGSSSTPQNCFAALSYQYFNETFGCGNNVHYINAGLAGTSSIVGNMRVNDEVFSKNADIIFIEFAVNDQDSTRFQKAFESLLKKCLTQENEPAVVVVTLCTESGGSCQDYMTKAAKNYDVPVISGKNAIMGAINDRTMTWKDYGSGDNTHPGNGGHKLIAECIEYYFRQALRSENASDDFEVASSSVYGSEYSNSRMIKYDEMKNLSLGSWSKGTTNRNYDGFTFSKNGNNPLKFTVEGKGIILMFQSNSNASMGTANVTVNGKTTPVKSNLMYTWGGQDGDVGYYQSQSGKLDVSISMDNPSSTFVLYGIAVIE